MIGTIISDIIGSVYEFKNHRSKQVPCIVVNRAGQSLNAGQIVQSLGQSIQRRTAWAFGASSSLTRSVAVGAGVARDRRCRVQNLPRSLQNGPDAVK
jgi:hypothetical protein